MPQKRTQTYTHTHTRASTHAHTHTRTQTPIHLYARVRRTNTYLVVESPLNSVYQNGIRTYDGIESGNNLFHMLQFRSNIGAPGSRHFENCCGNDGSDGSEGGSDGDVIERVKHTISQLNFLFGSKINQQRKKKIVLVLIFFSCDRYFISFILFSFRLSSISCAFEMFLLFRA